MKFEIAFIISNASELDKLITIIEKKGGEFVGMNIIREEKQPRAKRSPKPKGLRSAIRKGKNQKRGIVDAVIAAAATFPNGFTTREMIEATGEDPKRVQNAITYSKIHKGLKGHITSQGRS